jgi:hypothetical protein
MSNPTGHHDSPQAHITIMQDGDNLLIIPTAYAGSQSYPLPAELVPRAGSGFEKFGRIARQALWRAEAKTDEFKKEQEQ